jgi:hypothetical protein
MFERGRGKNTQANKDNRAVKRQHASDARDQGFISSWITNLIAERKKGEKDCA